MLGVADVARVRFCKLKAGIRIAAIGMIQIGGVRANKQTDGAQKEC